MRGGTGANGLTEIDLTLTNDPANEKMVIATHFAHSTQFI